MKALILRKRFSLFAVGFGLALILMLSNCEMEPDVFEDDSVVAQYSKGVVTADELIAYINRIGPKCHSPAMGCDQEETVSGCSSDSSCDVHDGPMEAGMDIQDSPMDEGMVHTESASSACCGDQHGGDHTGCCGGSEAALKDQSCEEHENCCMQHYDLKVEDYQKIIKAIVKEQMLQDYVKDSKIEQEKDIQDLITYVEESIYVTDAHLDMEESMTPSESEIRTYFEENKEHFGLKTLSEVRENIERTLRKKMHTALMPKYLAELRRNAFIRKSLELLKSEESSEAEIKRFYSEHRAEYQEPEIIKYRQISFGSRPEAEKARNLLWSGVSFTTVAQQYSQSLADEEKTPRYIQRGGRSSVFDENVFNTREGDTGNIFEDNEAFYIVQVLEKHERRIKNLEEVIDSVRQALAEEQEKKLLEDNANRTLFTVNNRSYSVEEFMKGYGSLSAYSRAEGKEAAMDRMIEYELLVDDARRKMFDFKNKETVQDITRSILQGSFYEKEIVGKIGIDDITDREAEEDYNRNKENFMRPPKAQISYIRVAIAGGQPLVLPPLESEKKAAKREAHEAYSMIMDGTEFDVVARKYSADDWSSRKLAMYEEKDMPFTARTELDTHPLHKVVFALEEGGVSKPIKFRDSYYIFKLWEKSGKTYFAFNEVKKAIKERLVIEKRNERMEALNAELTEQAQLVLNKRALRKIVRLRKIAKKQSEKKS